MGLSQSRALNGLYPYLADRVRWMGRVIEAWGGVQIYLSGFRTRDEQQRLFNTVRNRPVAAPGCSQHQYGAAVDVAWGLLREESPIGHLSPNEINQLMSRLGRHIGLVTVENDPGHFQIWPGAQFRQGAIQAGFCDPAPRRRTATQRYVECLAARTAPFGSILFDVQTSRCFSAFSARHLAEAGERLGFKITGTF